MKVWINSLQLIIEKMKDEEKWHNNYINILSRKKKSKEKGKVYSSHKPKNPVSKKIQPKDKSK